jgi:acyl-CoA reductase-like NAD-dependent aldehyde dehydrogenase
MNAPREFPFRIVGNLINGERVAGDGARLPIIYPATGLPVGEVIEADAATVDRAVAAARASFRSGVWSRLSVARRQDMLLRIHDVVRAHADELAELECLNTGIVMRELKLRHIERAAYNFRFFSEHIGQSASQVYTQTEGYQTVVVREPVGVAALLAPWNAPVALASMKVAAAIAFGNSCVLKPSEQTPLALYRFVELLHEAGLPPGVVNLVNGRGPVTGHALVSHPDIDLVSFTGGTETGRSIMAAAGQNLVPCTMELGGKSANIVFASADQDRALDGALLGIFSNNGQQCLAGSRILLERRIAEDFISRFTERARRIRIGDPMDDRTELGPLASLAHMRRVLGFVDTATADGCSLLTGGRQPDSAGNGFYVEPTAVLAPSNAVRVAQDEIFGPFATFILFDTIDEALGIANDSRFGLVSYVWSDHLPTVMRATEGLRSGVVWVNTPMMRELRAPFGGYRESGVGREGGAACEAFYTEPKTISIPTVPPPLRKLGA